MTGMGSSLITRGIGGGRRVMAGKAGGERGRGGERQMGGIGDGRDVMDYQLQFPGVTHFLIFSRDDFSASHRDCQRRGDDEIRVSARRRKPFSRYPSVAVVRRDFFFFISHYIRFLSIGRFDSFVHFRFPEPPYMHLCQFSRLSNTSLRTLRKLSNCERAACQAVPSAITEL